MVVVGFEIQANAFISLMQRHDTSAQYCVACCELLVVTQEEKQAWDTKSHLQWQTYPITNRLTETPEAYHRSESFTMNICRSRMTVFAVG